jgi:hypothetical protein
MTIKSKDDIQKQRRHSERKENIKNAKTTFKSKDNIQKQRRHSERKDNIQKQRQLSKQFKNP